jgi:hypothetical protein
MNSKLRKRRCRHCGKRFSPDYRNRQRQYYCSKVDCRRISKAASQRRWLRQPPNRDYFRGPEHTRRVQQWRKGHPGYWKKKLPASQGDQIAASQMTNAEKTSCNERCSLRVALQDFCETKNPVFIGLFSVITGSALQEDIASTIDKLLLGGRIILGLASPDQCDLKGCPDYDYQTFSSAGSTAAKSRQL